MVCNIDNIYKAFEIMEANDYDSSRELKWGFYFIDNKKDALLKIAFELRQQNYAVEEIRKIGRKEYQLPVSKVDIFSPKRLHETNLAFNELAKRFSILCYDGWDVEKINH